MAEATKTRKPTDAQLLARLRRTKTGLTAQQLNTTSTRLRGLEGVVEVGSVKTGKAGRPAVLFAVTQAEQDRTGLSSELDGEGDATD